MFSDYSNQYYISYNSFYPPVNCLNVLLSAFPVIVKTATLAALIVSDSKSELLVTAIDPERNNIEDTLNLYKNLQIDEFFYLLDGMIVDDINGNPDIKNATKILNKIKKNDIIFNLYEY